MKIFMGKLRKILREKFIVFEKNVSFRKIENGKQNKL